MSKFLLFRIRRIVELLDELRARDLFEPDEICVDLDTPPQDRVPDTLGWKKIPNGFLWGGAEQYAWYRVSLTAPAALQGKPVLLRLSTDASDDWNVANPQCKVFVNGVLAQGLDVNHREVWLTDCAKAGQRFSVVLLVYAGPDERISPYRFSCCTVDPLCEELFFDLKVPYDVATELPEDRDERALLIRVLNDAVNQLDLRDSDLHGPMFTESVPRVREFLQRELYAHRPAPHIHTVYAAGHTHIDVAWLWTIAQTRQKAARSFSSALRLMEQEKAFTFFCGQPQLYEFVRQAHPETFEQIREQVRQGRWEADGAIWVEADCNLTSGESLVRQILYGKRYLKEHFGIDSRTLWLPDAFGYSAALPQIMRGCGIDTFVTAKINWNETDRPPHNLFLWEGNDGSRVLAYFITTQLPRQETPPGFPASTYNGMMTAEAVMTTAKGCRDTGLFNGTLHPYGYGDGGGGPTREMVLYAKRLKNGLPGCPRVELCTVEHFLDTVRNTVPQSSLPIVEGELYLEYHRGTYTTCGYVKKENRRLEFLIGGAEFLSTYAALHSGRDYPKARLEDCWRELLTQQFHDILPGSSIKEVYENTRQVYRKLETALHEICEESLEPVAREFASSEQTILLAHTQGWRYSGVVELLMNELPASVKNRATGERLACQKAADGKSVLFAVKDLPPCSFQAFVPEKAPSCGEAPCFEVRENFADSPLWRLQWNEKGEIISLYSKQFEREMVRTGGTMNRFTLYEDLPHNFDAWDINDYYREKSWELPVPDSIRVVENGPVRLAIRVERSFLRSHMSQTIYLYAALPWIEFDTTIDWQERHLLLKTAFDCALHKPQATYDIQFGHVQRPTHKNTSWDEARFEVCGHKWADLSDNSFGVSLLNDGKYGHSVYGSTLELTLLRSPCYPFDGVDRGEHHFRYALYPHTGDFRCARLPEIAGSFNFAPFAKVLSPVPEGPKRDQSTFVSFDQDNIVINAVKQSEDGCGIVLRASEQTGRACTARLRFSWPPREVWVSNMLEEPQTRLVADGSFVSCSFTPLEIKTLRILF